MKIVLFLLCLAYAIHCKSLEEVVLIRFKDSFLEDKNLQYSFIGTEDTEWRMGELTKHSGGAIFKYNKPVHDGGVHELAIVEDNGLTIDEICDNLMANFDEVFFCQTPVFIHHPSPYSEL